MVYLGANFIAFAGQFYVEINNVGFEEPADKSGFCGPNLWRRGSRRGFPLAQIKAFAMSRDTRAKTDRIDAELIARFMMFRLEAGRILPCDKLRVLRTLTTRRAQIVEMRKRLAAQFLARRKQGIAANVEDIDDALKAVLNSWISDLEQCIECAIAR